MRSAVNELVLLENPQSLAVIYILTDVGLDRTSTQGTHPILLHEAPSDNVQGWLPDTAPFSTSPLRRRNLCILRGIHPYENNKGSATLHRRDIYLIPPEKVLLHPAGRVLLSLSAQG